MSRILSLRLIHAMHALTSNEENCIAFSSKSSGWLTAGCSNFGPAVGGCGYDAMAAGRGGQGKVEP